MKTTRPQSLAPLMSRNRPLSVGTLHEASGLRETLGWKSGRTPVDLLEARLDALSGLALPRKWKLPVIATARHPREGGVGGHSLATRRRMLEEAIPWASAIDVELRSAKQLDPVIALAHQHGRTVILSHHDFSSTPSLSTLRSLAARAAGAGADLFKVAAFLNDPTDLIRLAEFQAGNAPVPLVVMGMGPAGRFSRIVLAGMGAPLCYGWLGKPQVPGQWPALELRSLLATLLPE